MEFLKRHGPVVQASFLSTLEKLSGRVDPRVLNERLKRGSLPLFTLGGLAAGLGVGARLRRTMGPRAFWPTTLMGAMAGLAGGGLAHKVWDGGPSVEEELTYKLLQDARQGQ
jgi:hypothetical protein